MLCMLCEFPICGIFVKRLVTSIETSIAAVGLSFSLCN